MKGNKMCDQSITVVNFFGYLWLPIKACSVSANSASNSSCLASSISASDPGSEAGGAWPSNPERTAPETPDTGVSCFFHGLNLSIHDSEPSPAALNWEASYASIGVEVSRRIFVYCNRCASRASEGRTDGRTDGRSGGGGAGGVTAGLVGGGDGE